MGIRNFQFGGLRQTFRDNEADYPYPRKGPQSFHLLWGCRQTGFRTNSCLIFPYGCERYAKHNISSKKIIYSDR